ncbi:hypothetical protein M8J77_005832 [Diaphorina citri]|nr:hypothetical protein M8J77_005832 [Diaphorina citri]
MAELSYGGHNTTTTTVTSTSTSVQTDIRFDDTYLRTVPGLLKMIQIVLNLIGFILISMSMYSMYFRANFFNTVAMFGFWFTGILLVLYLFHIIEKLYKIPWLKIEFVYCSILAAFYFIASILCASWATHSTFGVAAIFGFCATGAYAYDAWIKYIDIQNGELAQGSRVVSTHKTTNVVSPGSGPRSPVTVIA